MIRAGLATVVVVLAAAGSSAAVPYPPVYLQPAWSPDGKRIAFVSDRDDQLGFLQIYVMNADGSGIRRVTTEQTGKSGPAWSPDGKRIAYQSYAYIHTVDVATGAVRRLTGYGGMSPDWSPRGRKIAYAKGDDTSGASIVAMNPDGSHQELVAAPRNVYASLGSPTWSPGGQRLAFTAGTAPDSPIQTPYLGIVSQYRGRVARYLVGRALASADWSPDGRRILLVQNAVVNSNKPYTIAIFDLRTRKLRLLGKRALFWARWSPDGRRIAYSYNGGIYVMNADGSNVRRLVP